MMCQVHSGACVSLLAPGKTDYTACHPRKTTTYILHVLIVPITTHTHDRRKSIGKETKKSKEDKEKERKDKNAKKRNRNGRKRKDKKSKKRQDKKRKQGKEERKKCHTSRP